MRERNWSRQRLGEIYACVMAAEGCWSVPIRSELIYCDRDVAT